MAEPDLTTDYENLTFSPTPDYVAITAPRALKALYITIGCLGLLGNTLVFVVILHSKTMLKTITNQYIMNQSAVDLSVAAVLVLSTIFEDNGRHLFGIADEIYCRLWLSKMLLWGFLVSSTCNLIMMTIERYFSIVHPIWHKTSFTKTYVRVSVVLVWLPGVTYNAAYMTPTTTIQHGVCNLYASWPSVSLQKAVGIFTIVLQLFLPLLIFAFCYIKMAMVLKTRIAPFHPKPATRDNTTERVRRNIFKTLALLTACFIMCWVWNQIYFLLFNLGYPHVDFTSAFYHSTVVAVFCNCCINPFVYVTKYKQFQRELRQLFRLQQPLENNISTDQKVSTVTPPCHRDDVVMSL